MSSNIVSRSAPQARVALVLMLATCSGSSGAYDPLNPNPLAVNFGTVVSGASSTENITYFNEDMHAPILITSLQIVYPTLTPPPDGGETFSCLDAGIGAFSLSRGIAADSGIGEILPSSSMSVPLTFTAFAPGTCQALISVSGTFQGAGITSIHPVQVSAIVVPDGG